MRVVVTGVGPVSAIGTGVEAFWRALLEGRSGLRPMSRCEPPARVSAVAAEVDDPPPAAFDAARPHARAVELAEHAVELASRDARLVAVPERIGVVVGTGLGNPDLAEHLVTAAHAGARISPIAAFRSFPHAAACEIARALDAAGPVATISTGCNSGLDAVGMGLDWIRARRADVVVAVGTEAELTPSFLASMAAARAVSARAWPEPARASRPFDVFRDGNVTGEGAAAVVLESAEHAAKRNARVRAAFEGHASVAAGARKPYDPFSPVTDPASMLRAMRTALADAGLSPSDIDAIAANGSSSVHYDRIEASAIRAVFGDRAVVWSTKGGLGQTGAGASALQVVAAVLAVEHGVVPPTVNADALDDDLALDLVRGAARTMPLRHVLLDAIGFGGYYHACAVVGAA
jgi:3-oxoacyl-[acyl-carrier-protein] synthase II